VRTVESKVEKFARTVRKKNTIFVVSVKSIIEEDVVVKDVAKLLKEYKNMFSVKLPPNLPPERNEDDCNTNSIKSETSSKISIQIDTKRKRSVENMVEEINRSWTHKTIK
jgi:hypothetical protein